MKGGGPPLSLQSAGGCWTEDEWKLQSLFLRIISNMVTTSAGDERFYFHVKVCASIPSCSPTYTVSSMSKFVDTTMQPDIRVLEVSEMRLLMAR